MPPHQIELIARAVIFREGRVLLCRNRASGYLFLPGGHVEFGEPAAAALARELEEEAGVRVRVGPCALVDEHAFDAGAAGKGGRRHHEVNLVFHVELMDQAAEITSREDHIDFLWADLAAAVDLDILPPAHKAWLAAGGGQTGVTEWISDISA